MLEELREFAEYDYEELSNEYEDIFDRKYDYRDKYNFDKYYKKMDSNIKKTVHIEYEVHEFLINHMNDIISLKNLEKNADWNYITNITDSNIKERLFVGSLNRYYLQDIMSKLLGISSNWKNFNSKSLVRQIEILKNLGDDILSTTDYFDLKKYIAMMAKHYHQTTVCLYENITLCDLPLYPFIQGIMSRSENPDELQYYWLEWYNKVGTPLKDKYIKYSNLKNKAAILNNFTSAADEWLEEFNDNNDIDFREQLLNIFNEINPLYEQIHAYVRYNLYKKYGNETLNEYDYIPMHLLGDMWAQSWLNIAHSMIPFPSKRIINITDEMIKQGYTPLKMFQMANDYFKSMGMIELPEIFWNNSIIEVPDDGRHMFCYPPTAWEFYKTDDVRVKQCTTIQLQDFITTHRLLGHIQYYLQYQHLKFPYRKPALAGLNLGFGSTISLSVSSINYLGKVNLLPTKLRFNEESRINSLFEMALDKVIFLPYAFSLDLYRHMFFHDKIKPNKLNCEFWYLRAKYSGIKPPVERNDSNFDPPAKYDIATDVEYMKDFIANIIQFQFLKSACQIAKEYEEGNPNLPLDNCDFSNNHKVGDAFHNMLSMGAEKPWQDVLEVMTGERKLSAKPLLEFFQPLQNWLAKEIKTLHIRVGWPTPTNCSSKVDSLLQMLQRN